MSSAQAQARAVGAKKIIVDKKGLLDNLREHEIAKSFAYANVCHSCELTCAYFYEGGNLNARDSKSGETFLHALCDNIHLYLTANGTRIVYMLSTKVDLDIPDANGDTVLHKVVRVTGAWRCIVALMRCGASPLLKNKAGRTPEEEILHHKHIGWEENLHWLRKFLPGLWAAVKTDHPDPVLIERLLKYWCRTTKIRNGEPANLKYQVHMCETQLDTVFILEKYENTNEMALAMLSGKSQFIEMWKISDNLQRVDINTKDFSYQFSYRDYPTAPRPLLAAVWEVEQEDLLQSFLELHPDMNVKYAFESESSSPPKPLFFHLVNPKIRPRIEGITRMILRDADLSIRNIYGHTVLIEAMYNSETCGVIQAILDCGANVADRDSKGMTARDHTFILKRQDYRELIDNYVVNLVKECDIERLESLVLKLYDHVLPASRNWKLIANCRHKSSKQLAELLKNLDTIQGESKQLFRLVKAGNKTQTMRLMKRKYANSTDKAGRNLLHVAIQNLSKSRKPINHLQNNQIVKSDQMELESLSLDRVKVDVDDRHEDSSKSKNYSEKIGDNSIKRTVNSQINGSANCKLRLCKKDNCKDRKRWLCPDKTPDHLGIIQYLIHEFPSMIAMKNNLSQIPLHYAHIFSAGRDVVDLLEKTGECSEHKDVFDFVADDYDRNSCGEQTFRVRRKPTVDLDLDIFITESNFQENFQNAINTGNLDKLKKLVGPLMEFGGETRYNSALFDCLDAGHVDLALYLVQAGFHTDITKQYEMCDPDDPMCAMMECSHSVTTLKQKALDINAQALVKAIDDQQTLDGTSGR